jgi:hypothetical protein
LFCTAHRLRNCHSAHTHRAASSEIAVPVADGG